MMRKWASLVWIFTLALAACGSPNLSIESGNEASPPPATTVATPATTVTTPAATGLTAPTASPAATPVPEPESTSLPSHDLPSLIPPGWALLNHDRSLVEGDLNKDGIPDIAAVIEQLQSATEGAPERALLIAFGKGEDSYDLSIIADQVILKSDEGGVWGDPFESLTIDRGSIVVSDYGGSNWRWYHDYRFRFQDNDWFLIGVTTGSYFTGNNTEDTADEQDYNLLTGDYILRTTDENGKTTSTAGNRGSRELIKLRDFNLDTLGLED